MAVNLRSLRETDSGRVHAWRNSAEVAAFMYTDHHISAEEHARWLAGALADVGRVYWIIEDDGAPVGLANLARIDHARRSCEWAYYLGEASVRGRGVGAAVEFIVLEHVFGTLGLHKLWCEVLLENEAVWRLHESFGFTAEALFRDHVWKGGRFHDVMGMGLLEGDWARARDGCAERLAAKGYGARDLGMVG